MTSKRTQERKNAKARRNPSLKVVSVQELLFAIFQLLPLKEINKMKLVSKHLQSSTSSFHSYLKLGPFPLSIWINNILPLLSYEALKALQRVSKLASEASYSNPDSLFLSPFSSTKLETHLESVPYADTESRMKHTHKVFHSTYSDATEESRFDGIKVEQHPILDHEIIQYTMGESISEVKVWIRKAFSVKKNNAYYQRSEPFLQDLSVFKENATQPPASKLLLKRMILDTDAFHDDHYEYMGFPDPEKRWPKSKELRMNGTGLEGAVTVEDIMRAVIKVVDRHPEHHGNDTWDSIDDCYIDQKGQLVITNILWN